MADSVELQLLGYKVSGMKTIMDAESAAIVKGNWQYCRTETLQKLLLFDNEWRATNCGVLPKVREAIEMELASR